MKLTLRAIIKLYFVFDFNKAGGSHFDCIFVIFTQIFRLGESIFIIFFYLSAGAFRVVPIILV